MRIITRNAIPFIIAAPLLLLAGCATQTDLDALRSEVSEAKAMAESAQRDAVTAAAEARRAAEAAQAASEKADRILKESLRK